MEPKQAEINIGMIGHVDHGKTTLTKALSGIWTDTHSEELRRGITIRLGYADAVFRKCLKCNKYTTEKTCPQCGEDTETVRKVSFVDAPGHETLMATMLTGASLVDGAVLVIAANEHCPQPQTKEHLMGLDIIGVKNVVIAQNKIELVSRERVTENYREIKDFVNGTVAENAPIIPISAQHSINIDALIEAIETHIPTPKRDENLDSMMFIARSFDVNRPGITPDKIIGGVIGGSLKQGVIGVGDEIEIRPGRTKKEQNKIIYRDLSSEIVSLNTLGIDLKKARPGGLVGVGTKLDPSLTKADALAGSVAGKPGTLPSLVHEFALEIHLLERVVGSEKELNVEPIKRKEMLMLNVGTGKTIGIVKNPGKHSELNLRLPVCATKGDRVAISRRIGARWRLIGYGIIE
ncbi:MAG: translation initiation factor IF-2 subunit gamma [Methanomicrobia archaeon]|nr:translation initiation factor IF-2 subunit gamma [Methanomicrobia archaeon]